ncbi:Ribokinase-like protein [Limtongia smithiae]|uniref:Ribokinase-like protein n=1 Tax=Limtongia smithiae TaxID=1125753 RepID=UPI0034CEF31B
MPFQLLCLGNPLLDIQANCPDSFLGKYDIKANDAILADEKHMPIFEDILNYDAKYLAGGAAQNSARGAQYILPPKSVVYCGCVGKDQYADMLREANAREGLTDAYLVNETVPTGKCAVVVTGVSRSLVTDLGAANHYQLEHLTSPEIWRLVEEAEVYYVGGYHLTVCVPAILALGKHAAENNKLFTMNFSAPFLPQFFKEQLDSVMPYWDIVIGNESEAAAYAESHTLGVTDVTEIAKKIAVLPKVNRKRPRVVVFTQGADPTIVVTAGAEEGSIATVKSYSFPKIDSSDIVDTNGAGDSFAGGFVGSLVAGKDFDTAIDVGHWLASWTVRLNGPAYPNPKIAYTA